MAATKLISSMNKTKPSSLFHSMRLNPISNKVSIAGVSATENVSETIEAFGRTLGFPIGNGAILNEKKPQFESFDSLIGNTTLADRFRVDVRGRPVISDEEKEDDEDDDDESDGEFSKKKDESDGDISDYYDQDDYDDSDGNDNYPVKK